MVVFSDFQCPFCKRVEPTLTQMEKEYGGKVRMVWKNYPLPFHQNAEPAAEAAMAADAQGKFWQMHDKLFENNTALDRPSLEKYAQELGLEHGQVQGRPGRGEVQERRSKSETKEGQAVGVNGTPGGVHQRAQDLRRLSVRDVQEDRRRRAGEEAGQAGQEGVEPFR